MSQWHAKVHKSGSKVAVFNGSKLVKVVEASDETFQPAEAQKFAENLVAELTDRTSAQMSNGNEQPSVTTNTELHTDTLEAVNTQAEGKGACECAKPAEVIEAAEETEEEEVKVEDSVPQAEVVAMKQTIASLKKKLANEKNERILERKARRGLAIAKQMVVEGSLEDSYEAIKNKVAEITKLEENEIDRLERKVANESEFDSIEEANKELRRQARLARLHRQAAAEAQEDGDETEADVLDSKADTAEAKAAYIQDVINQMSKEAEEEVKEEPKTEEIPVVEEKPAEVPTEDTKTASEEEVKEEPKTEETPVVEEKPAEVPTEEKAASVEDPQMVLAKSYRMIASAHRKNAEAAEVAGDIAKADAEDAKADEAEEKAEEIENKLAAETCESSEEEKAEEVEEKTASEESEETPEEEANEEEAEEKTASRKEPGKVASKPDYSPLKREGNTVDEFGIDKNASLVEQNDYSGDPEVEVLSKMWRSAPKDEE